MRKHSLLVCVLGGALLGACGDDGGSKYDPFAPKPECEGATVTAFQGTNPQVINKLAIGATTDGFDLDGDGKPDNKLSGVSSLAQSAIDDSLASFDIIIPMEFFDLQAAAKDSCVKFAVYLGAYDKDKDGDGKRPGVKDGDCDDNDAAIFPGATETVNGHDDNCNGFADEAADGTHSTSQADEDDDGVTIAEGDCNDTDPTVHPGAPEICDDGKDNDCDGVADRTTTDPTVCSPYVTTAEIPLDPLSFVGTAPAVSFVDGTISEVDGKLQLLAGPSLFSVSIPVVEGATLDLKITGATIKADVVSEGGAIVLKNGHLGGVIDAKTADTIRGLSVDQIGLKPEDSLLDAVFGNVLGTFLALPKADAAILAKYPDCRTPDIDVDGDGIEAYCDSKSTDTANDKKQVDICIDGDGTEVADVVGSDGTVTMQCSEALDAKGKPRFVDGISVELNFETTAVAKLKPAS